MLTIFNYGREGWVSKRVYRLAPPSQYLLKQIVLVNLAQTFEGKLQFHFLVLFCIFHSRYMGHFCGALAGFLVGLVLLENRKVRNIDIVCPDRHI